MKRDELLKILQEETDGFTEQSRLRDDVLDAMERAQEVVINFAHSCEKLCDCKKHSIKTNYGFSVCTECGNEFDD